MTTTATSAGTFKIGGDLEVTRLGYGAMRITGEGIWGEPADRDECLRVLRRLPELGVDFIDTADSYGPEISEALIAEALAPVRQRHQGRDEGRPDPPRARSSGCPSAARSTCASSAS